MTAFPFLEEGSDLLSPELLDHYVHDLLCMMAPTTKLIESVRVKLVHYIMTHEMGGPPRNLGTIHAAFWNVERHLRHLFTLLELVDSVKVVDQLIKSQSQSSVKWSADQLPSLYADFLSEFMNHLAPAAKVLEDTRILQKWLQVVVPARASMTFLLDSLGSCQDEVGERAKKLSRRWENLLFFHLFARDVYLGGNHDQSVLNTIASMTVFNPNGTISSFDSFVSITSFFATVLKGTSDHNHKASVSMFLHRYIYDFILNDISVIDPTLLELLLTIAVGNHHKIGSLELSERKRKRIVISVALQSYIISQVVRYILDNSSMEVEGHSLLPPESPISSLFSRTSSPFVADLFKRLMKVLSEVPCKNAPFDGAANLLFVKVMDQILQKHVAGLPRFCGALSFKFLFEEKLSLLERLVLFSLLRLMSSEMSKAILATYQIQKGDEAKEKQLKMHPLLPHLNRIFSESQPEGAANSFRLHFLKQLYRSEGTVFAQQIFSFPFMLSAFPWLR